MDDLQTLQPWLVLQHLSRFSPAQLLTLLDHFGTPQQFLEADVAALDMLDPEQREEILLLQYKKTTHPVYELVQREWEQIQQLKVHIITLQDERYPQALKEISRPPLLLYVKGNVGLLGSTQLAVVGARKSSKTAQELAYQWSANLAEQGFTITSGLAVGIDGAAHQGAISVQGKTIAVLAHGLDQLYPQQHRSLSQQIGETGALVSEFPLGMLPRKDHFPRRNRIISGLSAGVLVIEAAVKSGSLITARYALEQNRDVFAVPGSINNLMAKGCHQLIKDGAYLVESPEDIMQAMNWQQARQQSLFGKPATAMLEKSAEQLLSKISFDLVHIDELVLATGMPVAELGGELMLLEMEGYIEAVGGNFRRVR